MAEPIGLSESEAEWIAMVEREAFYRDLSYLTMLAIELSRN